MPTRRLPEKWEAAWARAVSQAKPVEPLLAAVEQGFRGPRPPLGPAA